MTPKKKLFGSWTGKTPLYILYIIKKNNDICEVDI